MMFLLTCDKKLTKSQLSPTHASTKRKITDELKHNAGWYEKRIKKYHPKVDKYLSRLYCIVCCCSGLVIKVGSVFTAYKNPVSKLV